MIMTPIKSWGILFMVTDEEGRDSNLENTMFPDNNFITSN
jgi:hypothetical protein